MRDSLPALTHVQTQFVSLAGQVGVGVEGSNATIQGDDKYHTNSGNTLVLPPLDPYGPATRYFDVFSRGTASCSWQVNSNASFVKVSQPTGTVGGGNGTDTRVYLSVDWASAPSNATATLNVTTPCRSFDKYGYPIPTVQVSVVNRAVPSDFTSGFVEADGTVAIEGPHYQRIIPASDSSAGNVTYHTFASLGRTLSGVALWPQDTEKLTLTTAPAIEYDLYLWTATTAKVTLWLSPSHNYLGDQTPLEYGIALFPASSSPPANITTVRPVGRSVGANLPDGWGYAVGDGVWGHTGNYTTSSFKVAAAGAYKLRVWALMPNVIVQKVVVDLGGVRPSYLGPPESFLMGRDDVGMGRVDFRPAGDV
jgi:hypothetical protein